MYFRSLPWVKSVKQSIRASSWQQWPLRTLHKHLEIKAEWRWKLVALASKGEHQPRLIDSFYQTLCYHRLPHTSDHSCIGWMGTASPDGLVKRQQWLLLRIKAISGKTEFPLSMWSVQRVFDFTSKLSDSFNTTTGRLSGAVNPVVARPGRMKEFL